MPRPAMGKRPRPGTFRALSRELIRRDDQEEEEEDGGDDDEAWLNATDSVLSEVPHLLAVLR